jgi:outer membrane protein TolC
MRAGTAVGSRHSGVVAQPAALMILCAVVWGLPAAAAGGQDVPREVTLSDAVRFAEARSERLAIARAGVARAEGEQKRAKSEYFPQVDLELRYVRTLESEFREIEGGGTETGTFETCPPYVPDPALPPEQRLDAVESALACISGENPFSAFSNLPFGRINSYGLDVGVSYTAYSGGRVQAQNRAAAASRRAAEIGVDSDRAQLTLEVAAAYWDALLADRLLQVAQATLTLAERTHAQMRLAFELGEEAEFEALRAQVTRDTQRPVVIQRSAERDAAYMRLKRLVGVPLDAPVALTTPLEGFAALAPAVLPTLEPVTAAAGDTTSATRAPVRQAMESVQIQEAQRDVARAQRLPSLSLFTAWGRVAYPASLAPSLGDFRGNWTVNALVSLPLFTGGRIGGEALIAQAGLDEARARLGLTRELAAVDSRQALDLLAAAEASLEASRGTVEQAERAYGIAEIRFVEGLATQLDVMDARIQLEQAGANRAFAARDVQVARLRVALLPLLPLALEQGQLAIQTTVTPVITGPAVPPRAPSATVSPTPMATPASGASSATGTRPGGD